MPSTTSATSKHKCKDKTAKTRRPQSPAYWEKRLEAMNLGLDRGTNRAYLSYGHDVAKLDYDGKRLYERGESLEQGEWPVSL